MKETKATTFFELLQAAKDLDLRDERGKVHTQTKNRCELMEYFADHFDQCIFFLKRINFL